MKKKILIGLGVVVIILVGFFLYGWLVVSKRSPITTTEFKNNDLDVKVTYCQPYKKGRVIFGDEKDKALQPYGKYWRLGANGATEITFNKPVVFGDKPVPAGTYRMYAIPNKDNWQVALNSELGVYFAINEPDYKLDVVRTTVPVKHGAVAEQFVIKFSNDSTVTNMDLTWDDVVVRVPIIAQ